MIGSTATVTIHEQNFVVDALTWYVYIALANPSASKPKWFSTPDAPKAWEFLHKELDHKNGLGTIELWNVLDKDHPTLVKLIGTLATSTPNLDRGASPLPKPRSSG